MSLYKLDQPGFAHLVLIITVVLASVIGFTGYNIYQNNSSRADSFDISTEGSIDCMTPDVLPEECEELLKTETVE